MTQGKTRETGRRIVWAHGEFGRGKVGILGAYQTCPASDFHPSKHGVETSE